MFIYLRFRFQRSTRRFRRDIRRWRKQLNEYFDMHIWGKWRQLAFVRRFLILWSAVWVVAALGLLQQTMGLNHYFLTQGSKAGGLYVEGLVGQVKSINPVLPESSSADDVSHLIFNGLTRYTPERGIEGDLASSWTISPDGKSYTFTLRPGVTWQDGTPFTAQDVLFTLQLIQNPDTRSPLANSWQGVQVDAKDDHTVTYTLPNPYPPFIYSTTVGIVPAHKLGPEDPSNLRVSSFNQHPVGTGPYQIISLNPAGGVVELKANPDYFRGKPLVDSFRVRFFASDAELASAYAKKQVTAIGRLRGDALNDSHKLGATQLKNMSLPDETDLFMKTTAGALTDKNIRQALAQTLDRDKLVGKVNGRLATELTLPLLPGQLGYTTKHQAPSSDLGAANAALDTAGWVRSGDKRTKDGQTLKLRLVTLNSGDYPAVADEIKAELAQAGVQIDIARTDVTSLQQSYIRPRNYDLLLYSVNIGADPDVYAYWHSSQASDPGLNLSQYSSKDADKALEGARVALDPAVRVARYASFLAAWTADVPAVVLYNPSYVYAVNPNVEGVVAHKLVEPADRFYGVEHWTVQTRMVPKVRR